MAVSTLSAVLAGVPVGLGIAALGLVGALFVTFRVPTRESVMAQRPPPAP